MSLTITHRERVAVLTLDRPPVNAMDLPTLTALIDGLRDAASTAGAIVIAGREGAFSAGVDLKAIRAYGPEQHRELMFGVNRLCHALVTAPVPTVAAVTGHALGGGLILLAACDLRVAAAGVGVYALPEVRAGIPFPKGAMAILRHALPPVAARRLGLADARVGPDEALQLGLVDALVAPEAVVEAAIAEATRLAALPADVLVRTRLELHAELLAELEAGALRL